MARNASRALAGFFPLPPHLLPIIAAMVKPEATMMQAPLNIADPCAGDGQALAELGCCHHNVSFYACEMEEGRYEKLKQRPNMWRHTAHGDFFHLRFTPGIADLCLLNPPYDQDRKFKRLEARWLHFATPMLCEGGVLVFVVPHYCLTACADTFALHYTDLKIYRFPGKDFETFKQVIVFARRAVKAAADPEIAALCRAHGLDAGLAPELPPLDAAHLHTTPARVKNRNGTNVWEMTAYDGKAVAALNPWHNERGPIPGLCPPADLCSRLGATYPVVSPPRPVHLVSALSAGVFNGLHVHPNEARNLPPLLVKGTFRRVWEKVDEKRNKDGAVVSETEIERPELEVWVLDLDAGKYHLLAPSGELTNPTTLEGATFADLLDAYSTDLLAALRNACPVLHDPARDPEPPIEGLLRPLWPAQLSTVHASDKHTASGENGIVVVGEVGTGKTSIALALLHKRGIKKSLVVCPPHLLKSWTDQVRMVLPAHYDVVIVDCISTIRDLERHPGPVVAILSREGAKLGHGWRDLEKSRCPRCGGTVEADGAATKRATCQHTSIRPSRKAGVSDVLTRWVLDRRDLLRRVFPRHDGVRNLFPPTRGASRFLAWTALARPSALARARLEAELVELYALLAMHKHAASILPLLAWALPQTALAGLATLPAWVKGQPSEVLKLRERVALAIHPSTPIDLGAHPEESEGYAYTSGILAGQRYGAKTRADCWARWSAMRRWIHVEGVADPGSNITWSYNDYKPGKYRDHALGSDGALEALVTELLLACRVVAETCGEPLYQATPAPRRYPLGTYIARHMPDLFGAVVIDECFPGDTRVAAPDGERQIRDLRPGDLVWSRTKGGAIVARRVVRHIERPSTKGLVRVHHEAGHFDCTPDHNIWCVEADNYVKAASLIPGMGLHFCWSEPIYADHHEVLRGVHNQFQVLGETTSGGADLLEGVWSHSWREDEDRCSATQSETNGQSCDGSSATDLRELRADLRDCRWRESEKILHASLSRPGLVEESNVARTEACSGEGQGGESRVQGMGFAADAQGQSGSKCPGEDNASSYGSDLDRGARRQRQPDAAAGSIARGARLADGSRDPDRQSEVAVGDGGPCAPDHEDRGGVRRRFASLSEAEEPRPDEGCHAGGAGLAGLSLLEQPHRDGSGGRDSRVEGGRIVRVLSVEPIERPDVELVYDLEIEETHNYFADGVLVSNCHEYASEDSAQGITAARLAQMAQRRGILLLYLTGSLVNGYAESAFHALRASSPAFRRRFGHNDREAFVDAYGLRKRVVVLDGKAEVKRYGAQSDRRQIASTRKAGQAPGVLPRLLLDHLLGSAAVLHQDDLELNLPPATEETIDVELLPQQRENLDHLFAEVKDAIAKTRFQPLLAGRLFGAITGLLAYPDLAFKEYTARWPDGVPVCQVRDLMIGPGYPVATVPAIDPTKLLPKEAAFLNKLSEQLGQDRGVLALPVHRETLDRLEWVLDQAGIEAAVLRADKVAPAKREGWIDAHLNGTGGRGARKRRVLLVNPTAVQTGLNNLVSLATPLWYENPECKPIVRRQANGRIRRPGQVLPVLVSTLLYDHPITKAGHKLLMHKVGVSMAVDGLDPQAVFEAAGVLTEFKAGLSVGRQLYDMLIQGAGR